MDGQASEAELPTPFRVGEWLVDPQLDEISRAGEIHKLQPRMIRLLSRLAESHGQVVGTQELLDSVWPGVIVGSASVYQVVSQLRKTLGDTGFVPNYIATVPRRGYRLIAAVGSGDGAAANDDHPPAVHDVRRIGVLVAASLMVHAAFLALFLWKHETTSPLFEGRAIQICASAPGK